jgi:hypothetical protein
MATLDDLGAGGWLDAQGNYHGLQPANADPSSDSSSDAAQTDNSAPQSKNGGNSPQPFSFGWSLSGGAKDQQSAGSGAGPAGAAQSADKLTKGQLGPGNSMPRGKAPSPNTPPQPAGNPSPGGKGGNWFVPTGTDPMGLAIFEHFFGKVDTSTPEGLQRFHDQVNNAPTWAQWMQTAANAIGGLLSTGAGRASDLGAPAALSPDEVTAGQALNGGGAIGTPALFNLFKSRFNSFFPNKK